MRGRSAFFLIYKAFSKVNAVFFVRRDVSLLPRVCAKTLYFTRFIFLKTAAEGVESGGAPNA